MPNHPGTRWITRAAVLLLCLLSAAPVLAAFYPLMRTPGETLSGALELLASGRRWGLLGKTCGIAAATALIATLLGAPIGYWFEQVAPRHRRWLGLLLATPIFLPGHVLAVAWIDVLGPQGLLAAWGLPRFPVYSAGGVVLVQALGWYPIPLVAVWYRLRHLEPAVREAARTLSGPLPVFLHITLPFLRPALATGALIVFALSLLSFSVPSLLQVNVFTVEIFSSFNSLLDQRQAVMLAMPLVLAGFATTLFVYRQQGRAAAGRVHENAVPARPLGFYRKSYLFLFILGAMVLPVVSLCRRAGAPAALLEAWHTAAGEIGTSMLLGIAGASLLLLLTLPIALWGHRGYDAILWPLAAAFLVSGPVFGAGLIQVWNHPGPAGYIYDRFPILLITVAGRYAFFAWIGVRLIIPWLPREIIDGARNLGAGPWHILRYITLPLLRRPIMALWACLFLLIVGELECIVLVAPPGWVPVSLRIFTLMHYGPNGLVSALALLQGLTTAAVLAFLAALGLPHGIYTSGKSRYHTGRRGPSQERW